MAAMRMRGDRSLPLMVLLCGCVLFEGSMTGALGETGSGGAASTMSSGAVGSSTDGGSLGVPTSEAATSDAPTSEAATSDAPTTLESAGELTGEPPPDTGLGRSVVTQVWAFEGMDLGDVDGDGRADLVTSGTGQPPRLNVYSGRADGSFDGDAVVSEVAGFAGFVVADVTGDGRADALASGSGAPPRVTLYAAQDGLEFAEVATTPVFAFTHMHAADLDDDGFADLLTGTGDGQPPQVWVWPGAPDGIADAPLYSAELWRYDALRGADVDGDGLTDVVTAQPGTPPQIFVHPGDGAGGFGEPVISGLFNFAWLDLGDLDGDGSADVATDVPGNAWRIQLYRALAGAQWSEPVVHEGHNFAGFELGDVNGDGLADVVTRPTGEPPRVEVYLAEL